LSSADEDDGDDEHPDDNNIDKAFKRLQKKKDKFQRFKRKIRERFRGKKVQVTQQEDGSARAPV